MIDDTRRPERRVDRLASHARRGVTTMALATLIVVLAIGDPADPDGSSAYADQATATQRASPWIERRPIQRGRPPGPATAGDQERLDLNAATGPELDRLPGIGPAKAARILEFRAKHGGFRRVADLRRVKGFGKKTVDRLAPFLTVRAAPAGG